MRAPTFSLPTGLTKMIKSCLFLPHFSICVYRNDSSSSFRGGPANSWIPIDPTLICTSPGIVLSFSRLFRQDCHTITCYKAVCKGSEQSKYGGADGDKCCMADLPHDKDLLPQHPSPLRLHGELRRDHRHTRHRDRLPAGVRACDTGPYGFLVPSGVGAGQLGRGSSAVSGLCVCCQSRGPGASPLLTPTPHHPRWAKPVVFRENAISPVPVGWRSVLDCRMDEGVPVSGSGPSAPAPVRDAILAASAFADTT